MCVMPYYYYYLLMIEKLISRLFIRDPQSGTYSVKVNPFGVPPNNNPISSILFQNDLNFVKSAFNLQVGEEILIFGVNNITNPFDVNDISFDTGDNFYYPFLPWSASLSISAWYSTSGIENSIPLSLDVSGSSQFSLLNFNISGNSGTTNPYAVVVDINASKSNLIKAIVVLIVIAMDAITLVTAFLVIMAPIEVSYINRLPHVMLTDKIVVMSD